MDIKETLKNPPKKYRPIPFWSWNEKLTQEETVRQIKIMDDAGMGGYFMHARGGLQTKYMGEDWFSNIEAGVKEGEKLGMGGWAYDENGWPSGFGGGAVNSLGEEYQQKYLRVEKGSANTPRTIANVNGYHFYYDVNIFYVDNLDKKVVQKFIETSYKPYTDRFCGKMPGIFTDEPQVSRDGIPWSLILPDEYKKEYNDDLIPRLPQLFYPEGDYKTTRFRFWRLVEILFCDSFAKQIYEYLDNRNMQLTGHMVLEDNLLSQITSNGAVMPNYEYFHIPGIDWLTRGQVTPLTPLQASSVAHQLGKKQILTESYALCGHNVSFEELRWITESQFVRGVNLICPHLEGYSLRGIRKRDYPPAMYYQQPWWEEYKLYIERLTRIGILLTEGRPEFDTLLIHPQSTAWTMYDNNENKGINKLNDAFSNIIEKLERKHILFHLGDERIMERHAGVEGAEIVIGTQRYRRVIVPFGEFLFESTKTLLNEFVKNGGIITTVEEIAENNVCQNPLLTYTKRTFDDFTMHYFVNETDKEQFSKIPVGNKYLDINTGEFKPFSGEYIFAPLSSLTVIDDNSPLYEKDLPKQTLKNLPLSGNWEIKDYGLNALTIDRCDYYFDGKLIERNAYVLDVGDRANALERKVDIKLCYRFKTDFIPEEIFAVIETPEIFDIQVNGYPLIKKDCGYFCDSAFRKLDISEHVKIGENEIVMTCCFEQSAQVYRAIKDSRIFESEKNKLSYDMEIEGIFIVGKFGVELESTPTPLSNKAFRVSGDFKITKPPKYISLGNIEKQGFPFFAGRITVSKKIKLSDTGYQLKFKKKGINAVCIKVNEKKAGTLIWNPYELDLQEFLNDGENKIELTIVNNLRNLMGPHHLEEGECFSVGPGQFYKNDSPFYFKVPWNDDYCFVEMSIEEI